MIEMTGSLAIKKGERIFTDGSVWEFTLAKREI